MIELRNVHKYYNRGKSNEIHVINNTSLTFPETGLVTLLGPSGCGKTTLLNAIGGLDTIQRGEILYDGVKMSGKMIDEIRIRDVGFIYQNYILFPERSVYENLALTLRVFALSEEEINRRIEYALKAVNMAKYKKRPARQLSGGQQQRVAIARALVKSPRVIIADEPTGNLDERNTVQIMNIIKKLSRMCLVILVTHEKRLANFYADRIIELLDGKVENDVMHKSSGSLNEKDESVIYLQDLPNVNFEQDDVNIRYFYEGERPKLKLNIVFKNNTFYFSTEGMDSKQHYTMLGGDEQTTLIDGHRPESPLEDTEAFDYDLPVLEKGRSKSAIAFKDALKMGLAYIRGLRFRKKLFLVVFFLASIMIPLSAATLSRGMVANPQAFQTEHRNIINVEQETWGETFTYDDIKQIENGETTSEFVPTSEVYSNFRLTYFERSKYRNIGFASHSTIPIETLKENELIKGDVDFVGGVAQIAEDEIIVDQWIVDKMLETSLFSSSTFRQAGGTKSDDLIGMKVYPRGYYGEELGQNPIATIVGISKSNNPAIYANKYTSFRYYINDYVQSFDKTFFQSKTSTSATTYVDLDGVTQTMASAVLAGDEIIVSQNIYNEETDKVLTLFNGQVDLNIVGYIPATTLGQVILSNQGIMEVSHQIMRLEMYQLKLLSTNKEATITMLASKGFVGTDSYEVNKAYFQLSTTQSTVALLTFTGIVLAAALVFLYFTMRSSLIARIYEVGVYRALGIKKLDVYKIFAAEVVWITVFSSMIGFVLASLIISNLTSVLASALYYPWYAMVASLVVIIVLNFVIGLLPIFQLLSKSPAEILSKYDI